MHAIVQRIHDDLHAHADAARAPKMQAYMKTRQPFLGVPAPLRKMLFRAARKAHPIADAGDYEAAVRALWGGRYREQQYQALEVAQGFPRFHASAALPLYEALLNTAENWDTVDWIAGRLVAPLVLAERANEAWLRRWRTDENMWLRRAALLAHLRHKDQTNVALLSETVLMLAPERAFFIQKAIGWALRDYSYANPGWVAYFVAEHVGALSGLSRREALKAIARRRAQAPAAPTPLEPQPDDRRSK